MSHNAQGFVEVASYVAAIETADAMAKGADVVIKCVHKVDGPIVAIICEGDVAACKAAVDVGCAVASAKGMLLAHNVIARPDGDGQDLFKHLAAINAKKAAKKAAKAAARAAAKATNKPANTKAGGAK